MKTTLFLFFLLYMFFISCSFFLLYCTCKGYHAVKRWTEHTPPSFVPMIYKYHHWVWFWLWAFHKCLLSDWKSFLVFLICWELFIMNWCWILSHDFYTFLEIVCDFSPLFFNMLNSIDWFHMLNQHFVMTYYPL